MEWDHMADHMPADTHADADKAVQDAFSRFMAEVLRQQHEAVRAAVAAEREACAAMLEQQADMLCSRRLLHMAQRIRARGN